MGAGIKVRVEGHEDHARDYVRIPSGSQADFGAEDRGGKEEEVEEGSEEGGRRGEPDRGGRGDRA